jgi:hypothetical protein
MLSQQQRQQQQHTPVAVTHALPPDQEQGTDPQQDFWSSSSSSSSTSQQQQKDRPDMGRRAKRRVRVPLPKRPGQSSTYNSAKASAAAAEAVTAADFAAAAEAAAEGIDSEAPGFNERAFLMGLLESMDPNTRSQFEQYMEMQLQQVEQEQQQAAAVVFLQAALDKAADKALNRGEGAKDLNPEQVFETEEGDSVMWQALRGEPQHAFAAVLQTRALRRTAVAGNPAHTKTGLSWTRIIGFYPVYLWMLIS